MTAIERFALPTVIIVSSSRGVRSPRRAQNGSVHRYLAYGFVALVVLLVALA